MALDVLQHATFSGPAFPEPFVRFELEKELTRLRLLPKATGEEGRVLQESWDVYRRTLRELVARGGAVRVRHHVLEPLVCRLGYACLEEAPEVETREGREPGGHLMVAADGARLRLWATALEEDLDAPSHRGRAYRFSHARMAQRVLLACGERVGLLTNGVDLRLLISDPARPDSHIGIPIDPHWKRSRDLPDTYRLLLALASPAGVQAVPELVDKARLQQTRVTSELRAQARQAIELFVQEVLDHPENRAPLAAYIAPHGLARALWHEGLILVYRLLFILKLEASDDLARSFSFASTSLWRNSFSPSMALVRYARIVLDAGAETGRLLEDGLRALFRMFAQGLQCTELRIAPLGGSLFGAHATPLLSSLRWGERAVAHLLDRLLWTPKRRGAEARERVHYGPLDVEDLGRVYEALLELEPGITTAPMCRLRRQKLEVVVPVAQGERYRPAEPTPAAVEDVETEDDAFTEDVEEDEDTPTRGRKTRVEWIEAIPPGRFYLRVGLGRKASGSYYTPHSFVRFLVQETLGPQVAARSPETDPQPGAILQLKVLDPAMGSGHFLVEACRFLGEKLYEACRLCDERALAAERRAEQARLAAERAAALAEAAAYRQRIIDLPDPDDELLRYLPSHAPEGEASGLSQQKAEALCRRLVAVHCLYGVDKNPLAVELAKLALWLESHAEGFPLTFLDHRLVLGDSLTGPFFSHLLTYPDSQEPMDDLLTQGLHEGFNNALAAALKQVRDLEASVGASLAEVEAKTAAKAHLDRALVPFKLVAAAWAGGVMLGGEHCDDPAYARLVHHVSDTGDLPDDLSNKPPLLRMLARGLGVEEAPPARLRLLELLASGACVPALPYELAFPEIFFPHGELGSRTGFDAVLGNPPWDRMLPADKEFFAAYDFSILNAPTKRERTEIEKRLLSDGSVRIAHDKYIEEFRGAERLVDCLYHYQVVEIDGSKTIGKQDLFRLFMERKAQLLAQTGVTGIVVPSAFHANEGATGIRQLYLEQMTLHCCYSFENRRKLFEIDSRFKFALVVSSRSGPTATFPCAFYLHDDEWLFGDRGDRELRYTLDFVRRTGGEYLSLLELRSVRDLEVAEVCFHNGEPFGQVCERLGIRLGRELNMTDDAWRFTSTAKVLPGGEDPRDPDVANHLLEMGYLVLHEGKTFHQFTDQWEERPRYLVALENLGDKPAWLKPSRYYRLAFRDIARSTDERTSIFCLVPAGMIFGNTAPCEREPQGRSHITALLVQACPNSFSFDWTLRQKSAAHVNLFILDGCTLPAVFQSTSLIIFFLSHSALSLTCNHAGYTPLWREQLGDVWREPKPPFTWPVLEGDDERWAVRAAIDAVVADAYGLSRAQYAHVLSTFSHRSYPKAPELCLACFDELQASGLEAFTRQYDPYWNVPLNENLPEPVIALPGLEPATAGSGPTIDQQQQLSWLSEASAPSRQQRTRRRRASSSAAQATAVSGERAPAVDDEAYELLILLLAEQGVLTSADAQNLTGLDTASVRPLLKRLVDTGLAVQEGQGRGTQYRRAER
jgi:hypothetical protein